MLDRPTTFYVRDTTGPLLPGEEIRARAWGRLLAVRTQEFRVAHRAR